MKPLTIFVVVLSFFLLNLTHCFYLPGVPIENFSEGQSVNLFVNKLTSSKTLIPYDYYYLPFPQPESLQLQPENLGEILRGDRIMNSVYNIKMLQNKKCEIIKSIDFSQKQIYNFDRFIEDEYRVNMILDNLPAMTRQNYDPNDKTVFKYLPGFPLGIKGDIDEDPSTPKNENYLNNHLELKILYHTPDKDEDLHQIVGFQVNAKSMSHKKIRGNWICQEDSRKSITQNNKARGTRIVWSYDVIWESSDIKWGNRWDSSLMKETNSNNHLYSVINSILLVLALSTIVIGIIYHALKKDLKKYDQENELLNNVSGWKVLNTDVFRAPAHPMFLSVCIGIGTQMVGIFVVTISNINFYLYFLFFFV
ncbi:transmembrane 9 superfamily member [Anaeramoeba flamelloides]|uniref:Transmembrane 9 superfamily member n=1 Tax=Anaeramoeba flamelloides TaxID=1746091 RepID=A0AAV8AD62_9EUKA|nr:transmembrane 9 superfamily member [Anaeramoeba flamelloides]